MKMSYQFGTETIEFTVEFRKRKTLSIEVEAPRNIHVITPVGTPEDKILETVQSRSKWIVQKLFEIREVDHQRRVKEYVNGESFIYMGRNYSLQIIVDPGIMVPDTRMARGKFFVTVAEKDSVMIRHALEGWYKDKAKEKFRERVSYYQSYFNVQPKRIVIKDQQKRWGSCTKDHQLLFNWRSIMAPSPVLDYIVVHEMCHLVYRNHSAEFWQLLKRILPEYEEHKSWLKKNGIKYDL